MKFDPRRNVPRIEIRGLKSPIVCLRRHSCYGISCVRAGRQSLCQRPGFQSGGRRLIPAALVLAALVLVLSGCHQTDNTPTPPVSVNPAPLTPRTKTEIYVVNPKATGDQDPLMPMAITLKHPETPARDAVEALLQSKDSPMPAGTALRGITIDSGLATLDFSRNPVNETGGEDGQSAALIALQRTLGQFPEIAQFQVEVKGQSVKTFGEFTTDGPMDVVRPGTQQQAKGATL